jgi:transposase-like protein
MPLLDLLADYLVDQKIGLKSLLTWFLNQVMQYEAQDQVGAEPYARAEGRKAYRNGYKRRTLKTRVGELALSKPQLRGASFETCVFDKYSRVEKALINAIAESYLQGVSTRKVQAIVTHLGLDHLSASSVSRISQELDDKVHEFQNRRIEIPIKYLFVDASYFKVRVGSSYDTRAFMIVTGVRDDGYREILGATVEDSEDELFWSGLFDDLKDRGLSGVELVVSDGHKGIQKAVQESFIGASWQMCHVHFIRALLKKVPNKYRGEIAQKTKDALDNENLIQALADELDQMGLTKARDTIDRFRFDLWNYKAFPRQHWKKIRTTNGMERINKELKRRSRVVGAFPNDEAFIRLAVSILININEEWITGNRYLSWNEV